MSIINIDEVFNKFKPEGVRVVCTYACNKNCKFCYQKAKKSTILSNDKFIFLLDKMKENSFVPIYFTFQGGELSISNKHFELFDIANKYYPQVFRKSVTSNGFGDYNWYETALMNGITHFTFSYNDYDKSLENKIKILASYGSCTVRINTYQDFNNLKFLKYIYEFCSTNKIGLTICEDLKVNKEYKEDKFIENLLNNSNGFSIEYQKHQTIIKDYSKNFIFWIYKHKDNYDYNNIIVLPNGDVTMCFNDVMNCDGAF